MNKTEIVDRISKRFHETAYPGDEHIVYDNSGQILECVDIKAAFHGKAWKKIPWQLLVEQNSGLSFFTPEAFCYYLPAYLVAIVERYDEVDVLPGVVVDHLTLPSAHDTLRKIDHFRSHADSVDSAETHQEIMKFLDAELGRSDGKIHDFVERVSRFNRAQGQAIKSFLEHMNSFYADDLFDGPAIAIERYWFIF